MRSNRDGSRAHMLSTAPATTTTNAARRLLTLASSVSSRAYRGSHFGYAHHPPQRQQVLGVNFRVVVPSAKSSTISSWSPSSVRLFDPQPPDSGSRRRRRGISMTATPTPPTMEASSDADAGIIAAAESFVREELSAMDGSHDWWHIHLSLIHI